MEQALVETFSNKDIAKGLAAFLSDHKCQNTVLIDISAINSWTDLFIITTVQSSGHLRGVVREMRRYLAEKQVEVLHKHKKIAEDGWELVDCGGVIIHLMTEEVREFYNLEKLWHEGEKVNFMEN